jgi:myo-inositol 2-dehydrogenase / D-chiro-inositol 1-dehydrogenase
VSQTRASRGSGRPPTPGLGIIGCGHVAAERHLPALLALREARVVAVSDLDPSARDRVGERFGIQRRYASAEELLDGPDIEAVGVLVPAQHHAEVVVEALEAEKHVLVEKPLALRIDDCERMVGEAQRHPNLVSMVAFNLRFHRLVPAARALIARGVIGRQEALWSICSGGPPPGTERTAEWFGQRDLGGGTIQEKGPHHYDLWRYLLGDEVEEVMALGRSDPGLDDAVSVVSGRMRGGILAVSVLVESPAESNEVSVTGSGGRMDLDLHRFDGLHVRAAGNHAGGLGFRLRSAAETLRAFPAGLRGMRRGGDFVASYSEEWRHFLSCIRSGRAADSSFEDGLAAARIAAAAVESVTSGSPASVEHLSTPASPRATGQSTP